MVNRQTSLLRSFTLGIGALAILVCGAFLLWPDALRRGSRSGSAPGSESATSPNVILLMADDMGWGDSGYNGNPWIETPNLDSMAREGLRFDRFYAASPVCSPTRASVLTGRSPRRMGIHGASRGYLKLEERTLAEALAVRGYVAGHFGKWHLGTMTETMRDGRRGGRVEAYSPPWLHGFVRSFSTETAVPTWDPMELSPLQEHRRGNPQVPVRYWTGEDEFATDNLEGDDSRIIMDRVIDFVGGNARSQTPFLAVVWFHAPHEPVVAGPEYKARYAALGDEQLASYAGTITAMDEQIGRLRAELERLGIERRTQLWFLSDNGPRRGSTGPFRGGKGSLFEGGLRVPGLLVWPEKVTSPRTIATAVHTDDLFPTVIEAAGVAPDERAPALDGVSLMPLIEGGELARPHGMAFEHGSELAFTEGRYKLYSGDGGGSFVMFDLDADPGERHDVSKQHPEHLHRMQRELERWRASVERSLRGDDYR